MSHPILDDLTKNWTDFSGWFHVSLADALPEEYLTNVRDGSTLVVEERKLVHVSAEDKVGHEVVRFRVVPPPKYRIVIWSLDWAQADPNPVPYRAIADIVEIDSMDDGHGGRVEPTLEYLREYALDRRRTVIGPKIAGCNDDPEEIELAYQSACEITVTKLPRDFGTGGSFNTRDVEEVLRIPEKREEPESDEREPSPEEAFAILASVKLEPFDEMDWQSYAGCVSEKPLIGDTADEKWTVIVDGDVLALHEVDMYGREFQFQLTRRL